jgi:hypothetical protein
VHVIIKQTRLVFFHEFPQACGKNRREPQNSRFDQTFTKQLAHRNTSGVATIQHGSKHSKKCWNDHRLEAQLQVQSNSCCMSSDLCLSHFCCYSQHARILIKAIATHPYIKILRTADEFTLVHTTLRRAKPPRPLPNLP